MSKNQERLSQIVNVMEYNFNNSFTAPMLLSDWKNNKRDIREKMGGNLIYSDIITLEVEDKKEVKKQMDEFRVVMIELLEEDIFMVECFVDFYCYAVGKEGFKDNRVKNDWNSKLREESYKAKNINSKIKPKIKINKGMKFSRALRFFFQGFENQRELIRKSQDLYSTYRQNFSSKSKGRVVLSIEPLDFMTISDNNHNWTSCQSILDGASRVGNLNYLVDDVTLVGYFVSDLDFNDKLEVLNGESWNSKRWRILVHLKIEDGKLIVVYNNQYPFDSEQLLRKLDGLITKTFDLNKNSVFIPKDEVRKYQFDKYIYASNKDICNYLDIEMDTPNMRLDMDFDTIDAVEKIDRLIIGKPINCLECGKRVTDRGYNGLCDSCSDEWPCDSCGGYYHTVDMVNAGKENVCYDCCDYFYSYCDTCNGIHRKEDMVSFDMVNKDFCPECYDQYVEKDLTIIITIDDNSKGNFNHEDTAARDKIYKRAKAIKDIIQKREILLDCSVWSLGYLVEPTKNGVEDDCLTYLENREIDLYLTNDNLLEDNGQQKTIFELMGEEHLIIPPLKKIVLLGVVEEENMKTYNKQIRESLHLIGVENTVIDTNNLKII